MKAPPMASTARRSNSKAVIAVFSFPVIANRARAAGAHRGCLPWGLEQLRLFSKWCIGHSSGDGADEPLKGLGLPRRYRGEVRSPRPELTWMSVLLGFNRDNEYSTS